MPRDLYSQPASDFAPLVPAELDEFERTGWVARRQMFDADMVSQISRWTDELVARPERPGEHMVYYEDSVRQSGARVMQRIEDFCPHHDGFDRLIRSGSILAASAQLLGGPAVLFKEKINLKLPGGGGFESHQDQQAGWSSYAPLFLTALVCVDRATMENGCLEMPHAGRVTAMIGDEWAPLTVEQIADQDLRPVPTEPGDVLFFDSFAAHASKPNLTSNARRLLYLTYNRADFGDHRRAYYDAKRASFPPDIERTPGTTYRFRV